MESAYVHIQLFELFIARRLCISRCLDGLERCLQMLPGNRHVILYHINYIIEH